MQVYCSCPAETADCSAAGVLAAAATATAATIPDTYKAVGPCLCVEVKPKAGFKPTGPRSAVPAGSIKRRVSRFMLHQLLKHLKVIRLLLSYECAELTSV